jgi:outer membrane autotransporter protein
LLFDSGNLRLVGLPDTSILEMVHILSGVQNVWYETAGAWDDRISATRRLYLSARYAAAPEADAKWEIWLKPYYGEFSRDRSTSLEIAGGNLSSNTSYNQMISGIQGGVDRISSRGNDAWTYGATLGYSRSTLSFEADNNSAHYSVWNFGAYASYSSGPLFAALLVNDDEDQVEIRLPMLSDIGDIRGSALGAKATIGERIGDLFGRGIDLQPEISLAAVKASLNNLPAPGADFDFASGTSVRATLGATISTDVIRGAGIIQPFLFAGIGNEFGDVNTVAVSTGDTFLKLEDRPFRAFGVASAGINFFTSGPFSAFVRFDGLRAKDTSSGAIRLGVHLCVSACSTASEPKAR